MEVKVKALWDEAERVWSASSDEVFGLIIEADSLDDVVAKLVLTFADLWPYSDKPLPPEVVFEVECIKEQPSLRSINLNIHHVPQQLATV
ncbi:MAG: DUF1902 domain-containing protein [Gammaproteobacteria bacterium]|nr:DUF1902 domain-containing protein [Gammaproteobacteria bacterium]